MTAKLDGTNGLIQQYDYQAPTTGFSYTFAAGTNVLLMNPAGTLATGTITMPSAPADGMTITISTTQEITALTLNGNTGQSIGGSQVARLPANSAMQFVYRLTNTTWYRITSSALGNVGTAPVYAARAWVNFNGTGTVAIRASGNVTSITDNGTGDYTVNFTTAMPDADYSTIVAGNGAFGVDRESHSSIYTTISNATETAPTTTSAKVGFCNAGATAGTDLKYVCVSIFR